MAESHSPHPLAPRPPAVHLAPPVGWMNDPNGLVFADGVFHAFYQHYPDDAVWGPMHWRHATSTDLQRWTDRGVVLAPDHNGWIFSGSAVVDWGDTAGFARRAGAAGTDPLIAAFTHHLGGYGDDGSVSQSQSLAVSLDGGQSWTPYEGNPVLPSRRVDFRDPKLFRHQDQWGMIVAAGDHLELFRSQDLIKWHRAGDVQLPPSFVGRLLECPDLFPVTTPVEGRSAEGDWLLQFSADGVSGGDDALGQAGCYIVAGRFDGWRFEATADVQRLDAGPDFYAFQTFSDYRGPNGEVLGLAWMGNWRYALHQPSAGTRGLLSAPRLLTLDGAGRTVQTLAWAHRGQAFTGQTIVRSEPGRAVDLLLDGDFSLDLNGSRHNGDVGPQALAVTAADVGIHVERKMPGLDEMSHVCRVGRDPGRPVRILVDHGSIEVFADDGATAMSLLVFAGPDWQLRVSGNGSLGRL